MARQDILIDARYGELETADDVTGRVYCDFRLLEHVDGTDNERYAYGELSVPQALAARWGEGSALYVRIPYTASYRELRLRLCVTAPGGGTEYLVNPADNRSWYTVQLPGSVPVRLSEFGALNAEGSYCLVRRAGVLELYSGAAPERGLPAQGGPGDALPVSDLGRRAHRLPARQLRDDGPCHTPAAGVRERPHDDQ